MKLYHKINKLTQRLTYRRAWRRAQRSIFRLPLGPLRAGIDAERLREIQQRYAGSPAGYAKYANVDPWLRLNRERVQDLKLHRSAPKRVLDLGCGGGFFLFILKRLGHSVLGLDVDQSPFSRNCSKSLACRAPSSGFSRSNRSRIFINNSTGSRRFRLDLIEIARRTRVGGRRNGISFFVICNGDFRQGAKFI